MKRLFFGALISLTLPALSMASYCDDTAGSSTYCKSENNSSDTIISGGWSIYRDQDEVPALRLKAFNLSLATHTTKAGHNFTDSMEFFCFDNDTPVIYFNQMPLEDDADILYKIPGKRFRSMKHLDISKTDGLVIVTNKEFIKEVFDSPQIAIKSKTWHGDFFVSPYAISVSSWKGHTSMSDYSIDMESPMVKNFKCLNNMYSYN